MWYFSWVLGLALACCFAVLNAMWFELQEEDKEIKTIKAKQKNYKNNNSQKLKDKNFEENNNNEIYVKSETKLKRKPATKTT